jgi:hypothetical protein
MECINDPGNPNRSPGTNSLLVLTEKLQLPAFQTAQKNPAARKTPPGPKLRTR